VRQTELGSPAQAKQDMGGAGPVSASGVRGDKTRQAPSRYWI